MNTSSIKPQDARSPSVFLPRWAQVLCPGIAQRSATVLFIAVLIVTGSGHSAHAGGVPVNEANIRDAILGSQNFTQDELFDLDTNADGRVDVADIAFLVEGTQFPLDGYQWLVSASFGSQPGTPVSIKYDYDFAVTVTGSTAVVSMLDELNPTKDLLRQNLSGPGQLPGANRPDYALSSVVPVGTTFTVVGGGLGSYQLTSAPIVVSAADPSNPTGVVLTRQLVLNVSTSDVFSDALDHGTINDQLTGFLPAGAALTVDGAVRLTRYAPGTLLALENPNVANR